MNFIGSTVWNKKYRFIEPDGRVIDSTVEATWRRVARALAEAEKPDDRAKWEEDFYNAMTDFKFLPAGRILAGAGTGRSVTCFNCYVMGDIEDSMGGIFKSITEAALTQQQGGGIGMCFSTLRPEGAIVQQVGSTASGPLSFMDVWNTMCKTIMSAGQRRGAMMGTMRCDHPDIFKFVQAKRDPLRFRNFNLSVLVTEAFMNAVKSDGDWDLIFDKKVYQTIKARQLWNEIIQTTYDVAEPGVIFIDRINQQNNLNYCEEIHSTNPCGEQPLPPYGACLLGSINLAALVDLPFTSDALIHIDELTSLVDVAIRMLDNVIEISNFPLPQQRQEAFNKRRVGLGITGLADALAMTGLYYGSDAARTQAAAWMRMVEHAAYESSMELAVAKGPFPLFKPEYCDAYNIKRLPVGLQHAIAKYGIRNSHLTSIAPTGTISLFAGNVSSGIEPIFALDYERKMRQQDDTFKTESVVDAGVQKWRDLNGDKPLPSYFVTVDDLTPDDHLKMQAALQPFIDTSIAKTINCPKDIQFEDFKNIYQTAYDLGLKGCTTYRPNEVTGSILSKKEPVKTEQVSLSPREGALHGETYKIKPGDHALYITINNVTREGDITRPFEIFFNSKQMDHFQWVVALSRMITAVFRRGADRRDDVSFIVEELKQVFDPCGGHWSEGKYIPSVVAEIGMVVERHLTSLQPLPMVATPKATSTLAQCPKCLNYSLTKQEGCEQCLNCDYSKCG